MVTDPGAVVGLLVEHPGTSPASRLLDGISRRSSTLISRGIWRRGVTFRCTGLSVLLRRLFEVSGRNKADPERARWEIVGEPKNSS